MWTVSRRFALAVTQSHQVAAKAELRAGGRVVVDSSRLPIVSGSVKVDRTAAVRRSVDITVLVDDDLIPTFSRRTPLDPYGNELAVWRGITFPDGTTEYVPQGVFRVEANQITDGPAGRREVQLTGNDRSDSIARATYLVPYYIAAGTNVVTAATAIVADRLPGTVQSVLTASSDTVNLYLLEEDASPWEDGVQKIALAAGAEAYFDVEGRFVFRPEPDPVPPAVLELAEGPDCVMTEIGRSYSAGDAHNAVIITGESGQDTAVRGEAFDLNPQSPTYWLGPFGQRPLRESNNLATSSSMADTIARTRLLQVSGVSEQVTMSIVPNEALDASDVVRVRRARSGLDDLLLVQAFELPLTHDGPQTVTYKTRRVIA